MDPALTGDEVPPDGQEPAGDGLHARIAELIDESSGLARLSADWSAAVALELVHRLLPPEQAALRVGEAGGVRALNLALYRMSYEAALACELARHVGAQARRPTAWAGTTASTSGDPLGPTETLRQRLQSALAARGDDPDMGAVETVGQLARVLCLGLIDAYQARDRYDYAAVLAAVEACDDCLPSGCTLKSFPVLECIRAIAHAGTSRDRGGAPFSRQDLEASAALVSRDRDQGGGPHADHALLLLVSAVGQVQRRDLVDDTARDGTDTRSSLVAWMLDLLQDLERRGVAQARDWPVASQHNPMAHHLHYYRYFRSPCPSHRSCQPAPRTRTDRGWEHCHQRCHGS